MPLHYGSTLDEHVACRTDAAVFDVSHLGTVRVVGADAVERLQAAFCNDLGKITPGRAQYTHLLADDGGILDDLIIWWHPDGNRFDVMPNASNTERVLAAIGGVDVTRSRAVLAVQGPTARDRLATVIGDAAAVGRFRVRELEIAGTAAAIAGTGYTGEDGVEVSVDASVAGEVWDAVVDAGVVPAGLGARDTLRLEAALPLHGQDIGPDVTPLEAGLGWVVAFDKGDFRGREALIAQRDRGVPRRLIGLAVEGRRPPRTGYEVLSADDVVGRVTSGNFSPTLGHGIALALVDTAADLDAAVTIDVRGTPTSARVVPLPFVGR